MGRSLSMREVLELLLPGCSKEGPSKTDPLGQYATEPEEGGLAGSEEGVRAMMSFINPQSYNSEAKAFIFTSIVSSFRFPKWATMNLFITQLWKQ